MNEKQGLKLLVSYEVAAENSQAYYNFVLGKYIPVMQALGLEMTNAWMTAYGNFPSRLLEFVAADESALALREDETWVALNNSLQEFVTDFSFKMIRRRNGFQF